LFDDVWIFENVENRWELPGGRRGLKINNRGSAPQKKCFYSWGPYEPRGEIFTYTWEGRGGVLGPPKGHGEHAKGEEKKMHKKKGGV